VQMLEVAFSRRMCCSRVLLPGLERHAQSPIPLGVDADADDAAGHPALEGVPSRHVGGVGPPVSHGHA